MEGSGHVWHREVISPQVERSLRDLHAMGVLDGFYLAGEPGWRSISGIAAPMISISSAAIRSILRR